MGTNKALLEVEDNPLWRRQLELLSSLNASPIYISTGGKVSWLPPEVHALPDAIADSGPLGGIEAGLREMQETDATHLIVVAVDLPKISEKWFNELLQNCTPGGGAIGQWPDSGQFEPLATIYPRELYTTIQYALSSGKLALQDVAKRYVEEGLLKAVEIKSADAEIFTNWNSPEDVQL